MLHWLSLKGHYSSIYLYIYMRMLIVSDGYRDTARSELICTLQGV